MDNFENITKEDLNDIENYMKNVNIDLEKQQNNKEDLLDKTIPIQIKV